MKITIGPSFVKSLSLTSLPVSSVTVTSGILSPMLRPLDLGFLSSDSGLAGEAGAAGSCFLGETGFFSAGLDFLVGFVTGAWSFSGSVAGDLRLRSSRVMVWGIYLYIGY